MTTKTDFDFRTIKSYQDACKHKNIDPNQLPDVSSIPDEFRKSVIAHYKLMVIYKAINNGWVPDWNNLNQYKYYPWFEVLSSGFGFDDSGYYCGGSFTAVGSRLCTDSREKARYIAEQFKAEYRDFLLLPE